MLTEPIDPAIPQDPHAAALCALSALAHPLRLRLFRAVPPAPSVTASTKALAAAFGLDSDCAGLHLSQLMRAGLIRAARHDGHVVHVLNRDALRALSAWLGDRALAGEPAAH